MWKYVSRRVKDTIELGINVRKSFSIQQNLSNQTEQQHKQHERQKHHLDNSNFIPRHQDPSRDKHKRDERFKKKYDRLHHNQRCLLKALSWSTALITGFYASQLLCLYRRNQRIALDGNRCYYSKYLLNTTRSNFIASCCHQLKHLLSPAGQESFLPTLQKFECPFKSSRRVDKLRAQQSRTIEDKFNDKHFFDPEFKKYDFFFNEYERSSSSNLYKVNNDSKSEAVLQNMEKEEAKTLVEPLEQKENTAINDAVRQLAFIVGELEFRMGVESIDAGHYTEAVDHFKLSTSHNHPGGTFNLALCYEQGFGVKKCMKTALCIYEIACELGHAKAFFNLGVFHAQGLGGVLKNAHQAKKYFEQAAELGCAEATEALSLFFPRQWGLPIIEETPDENFRYNEKSLMSSPVSALTNHNMIRRIAVT